MYETQWTLRARSADSGPTIVYARRRQFRVGEPLHFDPEYEEVTALEYFLGAVAADLVSGLKVLARRQNLQVQEVEAVVTGRLDNPLTYLGVIGEVGHPGLSHLSATVYASSTESNERLQQAWQEVLARSPLVHTLQPVVSLDLVLKNTN